MLNRRGFLGALAGITAVTSVPVAAASPHDPRFWWSGWRQMPFQDVDVCWWGTNVDRQSNYFQHTILVFTSMGEHQFLSDGMQISLCKQDGWPWVTCRTSESEKESLKQRALDGLKQKVASLG